jgi:hypothetical protein
VKLPAPLLVGVGLGLVALVGLALAGRKLAGLAVTAAPLVTPTSSDNIIYGGIIGGTGRALSGDREWSLGGWLYDVTHDTDSRISQMLMGAPSASEPLPY